MAALKKGPTESDILKSDLGKNYTREAVTLLMGSDYKIGSVLGQISASGKYTLAPATGSTGEQKAAAILISGVDASLGDRSGVAVKRGPATVSPADLVFHPTVDDDTKKAAKMADLVNLGFHVPGYVRDDEDPDPPIEPVITPPFVETPASISPASGEVGTVYTLGEGTYGGTEPITVTGALTLDGVDVTDDLDGRSYTSTAPGALLWTVTASNEAIGGGSIISSAGAVVDEYGPIIEAPFAIGSIPAQQWEMSAPVSLNAGEYFGGTITGYSILTDALPDGLDLDLDTGEISGAPLEVVESGSATIRATGPDGYADQIVTFEVVEFTPHNIINTDFREDFATEYAAEMNGIASYNYSYQHKPDQSFSTLPEGNKGALIFYKTGSSPRASIPLSEQAIRGESYKVRAQMVIGLQSYNEDTVSSHAWPAETAPATFVITNSSADVLFKFSFNDYPLTSGVLPLDIEGDFTFPADNFDNDLIVRVAVGTNVGGTARGTFALTDLSIISAPAVDVVDPASYQYGEVVLPPAVVAHQENIGFLPNRDDGTDGDWFVDAVNGDDGNDGTSTATAFQTIGKAVASASGGDVIRVREGVYRETVSGIPNGLDAENKTVLARYGTEEAIIDGAEDFTSQFVQCDASDEPLLGPNYAHAKKITIPHSSLWDTSQGTGRALRVFENGELLPNATSKIWFARPLLTGDASAWHVADSHITVDGKAHGLIATELVGKYTSAQLEGQTITHITYPNSGTTNRIESFNEVTGELLYTNKTHDKTNAGSDAKDRQFLITNLPAALRPGKSVYKDGESSTTIYVWPTDTNAQLEICIRATGVNVRNNRHVEIRGMRLRRLFNGASDTSGYNAIRGRSDTSNLPDDILIDNVHLSYYGGGYAACHFYNARDIVLQNMEFENGVAGFASFIQGTNGGKLTRSVVRKSHAAFRNFSTNNFEVSFNRIVQSCFDTHGNKINFYMGCENILIWGNDFRYANGYATFQASSRLNWLFNMIPAKYTEGRAFEDQNSRQASPAQIANENMISRFANNWLTPHPRDNTYSVSIGLGGGKDPGQDYPYWKDHYQVVNNLAYEINARSGSIGQDIFDIWEKNVVSGSTPFPATDSQYSTAAIYADRVSADFRIRDDSPLGEVVTYDLTNMLSELAREFPNADYLTTDINGETFVPSAAPIGCTVSPEYLPPAPPIWTAFPEISGPHLSGTELGLIGGSALGDPLPSRHYQWYRSDDNWVTGELVGSDQSYIDLTPEDVGYRFRVEVTARNSAGEDTVHVASDVVVGVP